MGTLRFDAQKSAMELWAEFNIPVSKMSNAVGHLTVKSPPPTPNPRYTPFLGNVTVCCGFIGSFTHPPLFTSKKKGVKLWHHKMSSAFHLGILTLYKRQSQNNTVCSPSQERETVECALANYRKSESSRRTMMEGLSREGMERGVKGITRWERRKAQKMLNQATMATGHLSRNQSGQRREKSSRTRQRRRTHAEAGIALTSSNQ